MENRMTKTLRQSLFHLPSALIALTLLTGLIGASEPLAAEAAGRPSLVVPLVDSENGRKLFVNKGCVICHSVAGVGGKAAPALDAEDEHRQIDLMDFVARMWRGAWAMTDLQSIELGYRIELSAQEIADLAAFASDAQAQKNFSIEDVPEPLRYWTLDEPYWAEETWPEGLYDLGPIFESLEP
jgi:cytochrome c